MRLFSCQVNIDKLSSVLLKALNEEAALNWIEERRPILEKKHAVTIEAPKANIRILGEYTANQLYNDAPNMYDLCMQRVKSVAKIIDKNGKLYNDFESALPLYQEIGTVSGSSPEIEEFNSIMEFLYLGRKANI